MKRVLICGGRNYNNKDEFFLKLDKILLDRFWIIAHGDGNWLPYIHIIHGAAKGADTLADLYAVINWCPFSEFPADWKKHGKKAGVIRNQQMLDEGKPDLVVAFPGGRGTADMVKRAKDAGIEVIQL